ncbi:BTAD domain-containing putative transcriptional regulator [Nocardiopsis sp. FR26]|uniref:ATP-binding protein n=1 Tax=Nocardiopsis sp. FR26 TaxID=2605987 RepID=UPI00135A1FF5|nr:BTAD domain-containing putative transcriptional regulator [Nocardiopsis sp. FR26]
MRFGVLGPLAVWTGGGAPVRVRDTKVRALLASLLLARGRVVPADRLVEDLWGQEPPARPAAVLQARVSQLRGDLDRAEPGARALVRHRAPGYLLAAEDVDAVRFEDLLRRAGAAADPRGRADLLARALDLWRGPVLAEFADTEPARSAAARWEELRVTAVEDRAEARLALGEHAALAADLAEEAERHPYRERLHAARIRALYGAGRQREALAAYERLRSRLAEEMGVDPGPALADLHRRLLAQDPSLDPVPVPAAAPVGHRGLPAPVGALVGREDHLRALRSLAGTRRLVTLTGPGGVGKTRLALEAARDLAADTALLVELAGLAPGGDPGPLLAAAVGARDEGPDRGPLARVADLLRGRGALLVLDNCEHAVAPVAAAVAELVREVPDLRVLATSQVPLDVTGEHLYAVPPLDVPGPEDADPALLAGIGAVRLFTERARAASSAFVLDAATAGPVATICRRLDGIPLALELAATRLRHMGAADLAARLDDRFALLGVGRRDAPARQRTLRAMIDWSWEPLSAAERAVLCRLAVHAGGCDLATAEAVCSDPGSVPAEEVLGVIAALVDRSLVVAADHPDGTRYHLLESVAAYAVERLEESGRARAARARHAAHFADLAERADARLRGPGQGRWLRRLDAEAANLRAALDAAVHEGDARLALRLALATTWYRYLRGHAGQARDALGRALSVPGGPAGDAARARVWRAALAAPGSDGGEAGPDADLERVTDPAVRARLAWFTEFARCGLGDPLRAVERVERAREAALRAGDAWGAALALVSLAQAAFTRGDLAGARERAHEAERALRDIGDRWALLHASDILAQVAEARGDLAETARRHEEGLRIAEELRLWRTVSLKLSGLGRVALLRGDLDRADALHERALRVAEEQADAVGEQFADAGIALAARRRGDLERAERTLCRRLEWNRCADGRIGTAFILSQLGFVAEQRGQADRALELHGRARREAERGGDPRAVALALEGMAGAHALAGERDRARELLERAGGLREEAGAPLVGAERWDLERITARLG